MKWCWNNIAVNQLDQLSVTRYLGIITNDSKVTPHYAKGCHSKSDFAKIQWSRETGRARNRYRVHAKELHARKVIPRAQNLIRAKKRMGNWSGVKCDLRSRKKIYDAQRWSLQKCSEQIGYTGSWVLIS